MRAGKPYWKTRNGLDGLPPARQVLQPDVLFIRYAHARCMGEANVVVHER
jgi:hypothetical protein